MGRHKPLGLTDFIPFICNSAIRAILFPCSPWFLRPPAPQQSLWGLVASAGSQFWEPSFTFGGQKSLMAVTFLVYWHGKRRFHFTQVTHKNGNPLQYLCPENPINGGAQQAPVHGVAKSRTRLSDFTSLHFTSLTHKKLHRYHYPTMEKWFFIYNMN